MKVIDLIGQEVVDRYFRTHVMPEKFRKDLPDGIYDFEQRNCKWRDVIINGCTIYTISSMWIEKGGPADLHPIIASSPWGTFSTKES